MSGDHSLHKPRPARFLRLMAAGCYDWLLLIGIMMVLSVPVVALRDAPVGSGNPAYRLFLIAIVATYFCGFWRLGGQTPGMRAWNLRLRPVGPALSWSRALLRLLVAAAGLLPLGAGYWWVAIDGQNRSWHDLASGTRVMREPRQRRGRSGDPA